MDAHTGGGGGGGACQYGRTARAAPSSTTCRRVCRSVSDHRDMRQPMERIVIDGLNVARDKTHGIATHAPPPHHAHPLASHLHDASPTAARAALLRRQVHRRLGGGAIVAAIDYFVARSFSVHVILPTWAYVPNRGSTQLLDEAFLLTPHMTSRVHPPPSGTDEDEFILSFAMESSNTLVLSNDLFRDHGARENAVLFIDHTHALSYHRRPQSRGAS